jgi:hypothetical protein
LRIGFASSHKCFHKCLCGENPEIKKVAGDNVADIIANFDTADRLDLIVSTLADNSYFL